MDRLVKSDVENVEIIYKKGQKTNKAIFRLRNLMHTMPVAISLTTTNPNFFSFNEPFSIIQPLSSNSYTLIVSKSSSDQFQVLSSSLTNVINVKSSMLPTRKASMEELRNLFSRPGPHVFRDAAIPVSLVGPDVVEFLIRNCDSVPDVMSCLNRATRGCTEHQLTELLKDAVSLCDQYFVKSLIDLGADVNCKDAKGRSLISSAVKACRFDVVKVLITSGCVVNESVDHVLHDAAALNRADLMEILCSNFKTVNINSVNSYGRTPIHVAAGLGHAEVIKFCVSNGGNADALDPSGSSPLHLAAEKGDFGTVETLLNHSDLVKYAVNKEGKTPYAVAVENEHSHLYEILYVGDELHAAARKGDVESIRKCIQQGVNINVQDQNGMTPLHRAAFKGRIESVKLLLNHGALVDVADCNGYTPLDFAMEGGHLQVGLLLIGNGAKKVDVKRLRNGVGWNSVFGWVKGHLGSDCVVAKKKCVLE